MRGEFRDCVGVGRDAYQLRRWWPEAVIGQAGLSRGTVTA